MNPPQSENSTCPLEVRVLHYSYPDGHKALNGVSFRLRDSIFYGTVAETCRFVS